MAGYQNYYGGQSYGLPIPYTATISPPLSHGTQIHVSGTPTGNRFAVNLKNYQDDTVLHFNPRFEDNALVLNSAQRGSWGQEERRGLPMQRGVRFTLVIMVTHHGFSIAVNNSHLCEFHQRLPMHSAQLLEIKGDINLESAQIYSGGMGGSMGMPPMGMGMPPMGMGMPPMGTGMPFTQPRSTPFGGDGGAANFPGSYNYPSAPPVDVLPSYPMGGGGSGVPSIQSCHIHVGSRIFVRGHIHPNANRFELNFLQGYNDGDDVAFHFNPRFDTRTIVKNHRQRGQWGSEENQPFPSYMPLMPGVTIDLQVTCQTDRYTVYMNNHLIAEYRHKIPPGFVKAIQYKGDITVTSVGQL